MAVLIIPGGVIGALGVVSDGRAFKTLEAYLASVPAIQQSFGHGYDASGVWWVKFSIDIEHPLAWHVVQELGHVLNYLSIDEPSHGVQASLSTSLYEWRSKGVFVVGHRVFTKRLQARHGRGVAQGTASAASG